MHNLLYFNNNKHMNELSLRLGNASVYGFHEPQPIQRSKELQFEYEDYIKQ